MAIENEYTIIVALSLQFTVGSSPMPYGTLFGSLVPLGSHMIPHLVNTHRTIGGGGYGLYRDPGIRKPARMLYDTLRPTGFLIPLAWHSGL